MNCFKHSREAITTECRWVKKKQLKNYIMNKIITVALASAKPSVEALLELINATSNPTVATEILLGIYEDPTINPTPAFEINSQTNIVFGSYDKFTEEIAYTYNRVEMVSAWLPNNVDVSLENAVSRNMWPEDVAESLKLSVETFKANYTRHNFVTNVDTDLLCTTCSLKKWNTGTNK